VSPPDLHISSNNTVKKSSMCSVPRPRDLHSHRKSYFICLFVCLFVSVNVNGKVVPLHNSAPPHEDVLGEWTYSSTHSLTSALDGSEWSASHPVRFTPRERAPGTHWIGGWVGSSVGLDAMVKRKIPSPCWDSNPRSSNQ
jgi:hypothetical protein